MRSTAIRSSTPIAWSGAHRAEGGRRRARLRRQAALSTISKHDLARGLGYAGDMAALDEALEAAGLSRPEKGNISSAKRRAAADVVAERFVLVCNRGDCRAEAQEDERVLAPAVDASFCEICGGSPAAAAIEAMQAACAGASVHRVVVLGGSPSIRSRMQRDIGPPLELRLVDGTVARSRTQARDDLLWADLVVIWAGTELAHKATMAYPAGDPRVITVARRGIPALARAVTKFARGRATV